jgi:hypothetical protein
MLVASFRELRGELSLATALIQLDTAAGRVGDLGLRLGAEKAFESGVELSEKAGAVFDMSGEATWAHSMNLEFR